ncbi:uncharacterized protein MYCGRDRAFT_78832, partial [Zymoseptoria tritici IPO323]
MTAFTKDLKRKDRGPNGKPTTRAGANLTKQSTEFVNQLVAAAGNDVKEFLKAKPKAKSKTPAVPKASGGGSKVGMKRGAPT